MKKIPRPLHWLLALVLTAALVPSLTGRGAAVKEPAAYRTKDNGQSYYIMVNRAQNTVTVYGLDGEGYYRVPVKAMVCSVGREGHETPLGTFALTGRKKEWCPMLDGTYGQYSNQFSGYYLFHSVCYSEKDPAALLTEEYNMLGQPASLGCVRLQTADAKWIYDNCGAGTKVTVYDGEEPGPLGKPEKLVEEITPEMVNGWDPTDPREENPWHSLLVEEVKLDETDITLEAGVRRRLWPEVDYGGVKAPPVTWTVSDPNLASVDPVGRVTGLRAGRAVVTARCGGAEVQCTVTVTGELLHFVDVAPGSWYYSDVRYAYEHGIFSGTGERTFDPEGNMTAETMAQVLYNMAGRPRRGQAGEGWADDARSWAGETGLLEGLEPEAPLNRQGLVQMLYRYATNYRGRAAAQYADLAAFGDGAGLSGEAELAFGWAVGCGLLQGTSDNRLAPELPVPRAQGAVLLGRYHALFGG